MFDQSVIDIWSNNDNIFKTHRDGRGFQLLLSYFGAQ